MPFSAYLQDRDTREERSVHQTHYQSQVQYPGYGVYPSVDAAPRHYADYYPPPAPSSSSPHSLHNCSTGPSSSQTATGDGNTSSGNSNSGKTYAPALSSRNNGNDGFFQMPSFLMGSFGGTLAPGGGAEVLTPGTMGMFDFVSSPYALPPPASAMTTQQPASGNEKHSWQTSKYYTFDEQIERADDASVASANSRSAHTSGPEASPFGYLNADSPMRQHANMNAEQHEDEEIMDEDENDNDSTAAARANLVSPEEGPSASEEYHVPLEVSAPTPSAGLPVYSQSGFDMLSILARVARRPNQTITLGPVDLTCSFVVSDVRRADAPIIYASPTFCALTGYPENEVLGQNCRFLQAPGGHVARSEVRRFTSPDAVRELRFALDKDREVQVSLINYRKDERPFVNRVSIVPIPAEDDESEIAFHVGFQVDLNEQPGLIAQRMHNGKFWSEGTVGDPSNKSLTPAQRSARATGKKLRALLSDPSFQSSAPLTISSNLTAPSSTSTSTSNPDSSTPAVKSNSGATKPDTRDERQWLNLLLLEHMPDFVHVLSLKGHFLYVSPGITRFLGYAPTDLVGKSVGDFCHPSDAVPLLRELKESTGQAVAGAGAEPNKSAGTGASSSIAPTDAYEASQKQLGQRVVNLLFRMRTKAGAYVWVESVGRLHVEAGKGRKAVVLSGRVCGMPNLRWGAISRAGGLLGPSPNTESGESKQLSTSSEQEFWAMLCSDGLFLVAGMGVRDLLGWGAGEMIGRSIRDFVYEGKGTSDQVINALRRANAGEERGTQILSCHMKKRDEGTVPIQLVVYANESRAVNGRIIVQFKLSSPPLPSPSPTSAYSSSYSPTTYQNTPYTFSFNHSPPSSAAYGFLDDNRSAPQPALATAAGRILHAPTTSVFAEFETHRGTSWQYELQQLKFANGKLREEVNVLEARRRLQHQHQHLQTTGPRWVDNAQLVQQA